MEFKTIEEIETRMAEIAGDVETRGASLPENELTAYEAEASALVERRKAMAAANERRGAMLAAIAKRADEIPTRAAFPGAAGADDPADTPEYRSAFRDYVTAGRAMTQTRADQVTYTTDVGAVIPTTVLNKIVQSLDNVGMILPLVTRTAHKGGVAVPKSAVRPVASWVAEGAGSDKQKKTVGSVTFGAYKLRCAVAMSIEVETMSLPAFEAQFIKDVSDAMTKALEQAIIAGDGLGKPTGILSGEVAPAAEFLAGAPGYATLIDMEGALPDQYDNSAVYCMTKAMFMQFIGMTDKNEQPVARVDHGLDGKVNRMLLGRKVVLCPYLAAPQTAAAGDVVAFLYDFKDYVLNTNMSMTVKRYEDNDTDDQVAKAILLADGKPVLGDSLVVLRHLAE